MMTQSYHGEGYDAFGRPHTRAPSSATYHERPNPYTHSYYDTPQQDLRSEYIIRSGTRTSIQEQASDNSAAGLQRRRIQVACSRCRRRKIKCTGDPGDGGGCSACRSVGAGRSSCTFNRVGSHALSAQVLDVLPTTGSTRCTTPTPTSYNTETLSNSYHKDVHQPRHRSSLPLLQTRSAYPDYNQYGSSPPDDYSYSSTSLPRQLSYPSSYGAESFRPYTTSSVAAPSTSASMYYEPGTAFSGSFGCLQAAPTYHPTPTNRVLSASNEVFSPLNMASMHSSLPQQTAPDRQLPMPTMPVSFKHTHAPPTYTISDSLIRPLGPFAEPRAHINGIHSRTGMPWSSESMAGPSTNRIGSLSTLPLSRNDSSNETSGSAASSYSGDAILGYQFSASTGSPTTSPTAGLTLSDSFPAAASSSMLPPVSKMRMPRGSSYPNLPSLTGGGGDDYHQRSSSSSREAAASLYSFSTSIDLSERTSSERHCQHRHRNNNSNNTINDNGEESHSGHRTSPSQHAASGDESRRGSSYDHHQQQQQQQQSATSHPMSVPSLHARY